MSANETVDDAGWIAACTARMVALDPVLDPALARPIAEDMCTRQRWRSMRPEAAAETVFDYGNKAGASPE